MTFYVTLELLQIVYRMFLYCRNPVFLAAILLNVSSLIFLFIPMF